MEQMKTKKINKISIYILVIVLIIFVCVSSLCASNINDKSHKVKSFIDKHSHTMHKPPSGWGGVAYKDIQFSNAEIAGIGYWDEYFCLYSRSCEKTYINSNLGWIEYTVCCEISFEWDEFGSDDFFARIIFERKDFPDHTVAYVEATNWSSEVRKPRFTNITIYENSTEFGDDQLEDIASLAAHNLVWDANDFLETSSLPTLY